MMQRIDTLVLCDFFSVESWLELKHQTFHLLFFRIRLVRQLSRRERAKILDTVYVIGSRSFVCVGGRSDGFVRTNELYVGMKTNEILFFER